jgi:hypothetical protein
MNFFLAFIFFFQFLVIKALDPDWIRIRIGIQPKMLDPDEMNADQQPCLIVFSTDAGKGSPQLNNALLPHTAWPGQQKEA